MLECLNVLGGNVVVQSHNSYSNGVIEILDDNFSIIEQFFTVREQEMSADDNFLVVYYANNAYGDTLSSYAVGKNMVSKLMHIDGVKNKIVSSIREIYSGKRVFRHMAYHNGRIGFVEYHDNVDWNSKTSHIVNLAVMDF